MLTKRQVINKLRLRGKVMSLKALCTCKKTQVIHKLGFEQKALCLGGRLTSLICACYVNKGYTNTKHWRGDCCKC